METFAVASLEVQEKELVLRENPTLADLQRYVVSLKKLRSFHTRPDHAYVLLTKEVGELAGVIRKTWLTPDDVPAEVREEIGLELADILIYFLDIANQYGVQVEQAFRKKEEQNKRRHWPEYYHSE